MRTRQPVPDAAQHYVRVFLTFFQILGNWEIMESSDVDSPAASPPAGNFWRKRAS